MLNRSDTSVRYTLVGMYSTCTILIKTHFTLTLEIENKQKCVVSFGIQYISINFLFTDGQLRLNCGHIEHDTAQMYRRETDLQLNVQLYSKTISLGGTGRYIVCH